MSREPTLDRFVFTARRALKLHDELERAARLVVSRARFDRPEGSVALVDAFAIESLREAIVALERMGAE